MLCFRMAHSGELMVIYNFEYGVGGGSISDLVKLQDWHTKFGFKLREMIWKDSQNLFSKCGLDDPICLWLWNHGDEQPIDLQRKLGDIFAVDATLVKVFITSRGATKYNEPLRMGSAGTSAAPSNDVSTAESDALTVSDCVVSMAASDMKSGCYDTLIRAARVELYETDAFQHNFDNLMEASAACCVWDNVAEPHQLQAVLSEVKGWVDLPAHLTWENCSRQPATVWWGNDVELTATNDILLYHGSYVGFPELAGVLGIEVKKKMQRRDMYQALGDSLCWGGRSRFPFVQLLTDMMTGGVFIFAAKEDGTTLHIVRDCYVSMEGVKDFVNKLVEGLPPKLGHIDVSSLESFPDKLHRPERIEISNLVSKRPWPMVWDCRSDDDVANLSDLEGFDLGALPTDMEVRS